MQTRQLRQKKKKKNAIWDKFLSKFYFNLDLRNILIEIDFLINRKNADAPAQTKEEEEECQLG